MLKDSPTRYLALVEVFSKASSFCYDRTKLVLFKAFISAIFYQIFIFTPNDSPLKTMKNVFYFI